MIAETATIDAKNPVVCQDPEAPLAGVVVVVVVVIAAAAVVLGTTVVLRTATALVVVLGTTAVVLMIPTSVVTTTSPSPGVSVATSSPPSIDVSVATSSPLSCAGVEAACWRIAAHGSERAELAANAALTSSALEQVDVMQSEMVGWVVVRGRIGGDQREVWGFGEGRSRWWSIGGWLGEG
ncbi:hypothetical protein BC829DRAFT_250930 [Chytridium lagenaria]|nr:hypothetical protein BC829DRAFT_250930 [Chytridium lagenaria]